MKRQLSKLLSLASIATCGLASAMSYSPDCNPCGVCDPCCGSTRGGLEVWADALYFKPSSCNFGYVVPDRISDPAAVNPVSINTTFPNGCERSVNPKYHWGFRVGATLNGACCCSQADATIYYSRLNTKDRRFTPAIGNEVLWPSAAVSNFTPPMLFTDSSIADAFAFADVRHKWNAVDAEVGYRLNNCGCFSVRGHIGLHWAEIDVQTKIGYNGTFTGSNGGAFKDQPSASEYFTSVKTWGIGPRFGTDFSYDLGCGLGLVARASWAVLAGETKHRVSGVNFNLSSGGKVDAFTDQPLRNGSAFTFSVCNKNRCVVFPEFDTSVGINYNVCFCNCFNCLFELGWEFRTYLQSVVHSYYVDRTTPGNAAVACDPFNLQGLYIRGLVKF